MKNLLLAFVAIMCFTSFTAAQVPSYVPSSGLVGWYPFTGNPNDISGNGNHGTLLNGITLTNDRFGYSNSAYYVDGVDILPARGLSLPVNLLNGSDYSISMWMQTTNTGKIRQTVFNSNPHAIQLLNYNHTVSPGIMGGWISDGTEPWGITGATNNFTMPNYTTWNNIVMVKTAADVKYYVNGALARTQPIGAIGNTAFNLYFGSIGFDGGIGQHSFEGNLDDVGIWNRALSPSEILVLHQSTFAAPTLIAPLNGATGISTSPNFDWSDVPFATKYHLQVSALSDFSVLLINKNDIAVSNYTPPAPLALNTTYYWRVYAGDNFGWSYASGSFNFTSMAAPPWSLYQTGVPYSLFGVDFAKSPNDNIGVAVGQGGTVIKTTDAGEEWTLVYSNINIWMNDVQFDQNQPGVVWAAGMGGVIIKSMDFGSTWTVVRPFSTPDHTIRGISTRSGQLGYVSFVGYAGTFFETFNNGASFVQRFDIPFTMHSIAYSPNFPVDGRGIISGTDGKVWNTTNFGANWIARNSNRFDYLNDVVFINPNEAMICGNNGTILRSTNWGRTWTVNVQYLTSEHLRSIDAFDNKVTVCGDNGKIMTANDFGVTFIDQLNGENRHFYGVSLRQASIGVVVGEIGTAGTGAPLYYTSMNGGFVGITQIGTETPKNFSMSQNYPNPFNPTTKINFAIPKQGMVTLKVYDMLGKEIKTLVNEVKSAGSYTVDFNGSQFSSGVYFYKIQTSEFSEVKRMMLVK